MSALRIATRQSPLARWQAEHVRAALLRHNPSLQIDLLGMTTAGDRLLDAPLAGFGGKGLFVKELEACLLAGSADIAVHSMKDVTISLPEGLEVPVILEREDPRDAFVSNHHARLRDLPSGARIGTSSLRRRCQLLALRPDLVVENVRGNVGTRLGKLDAGHFDALVLASAGLKRLGFAERARETFSTALMLPAIGQGAIGIECRTDDARVRSLIAALDDAVTHACVKAERALNRRLGGACQVPIAGHGIVQGEEMHLRALVARLDGTDTVRGEIRGPIADAEILGDRLGADLLARGAGAILEALLSEPGQESV